MERTRAFRRAQRERVIANRLREIKNSKNDSYKSTSYYNFKSQHGGLAKRKPFDCGTARCGVCHSEKVIGKERSKYDYDWIIFEEE